MALKCTNSTRDAQATRIMAMPLGVVRCLDVNPYCDEHAAEVAEMGGLPANGSALSEQAQAIGGIR